VAPKEVRATTTKGRMPETLKSPLGHVCDCGQPAVRKKGAHFVCATCDDIERRLYDERKAEGQRMRTGHRGPRAICPRA